MVVVSLGFGVVVVVCAFLIFLWFGDSQNDTLASHYLVDLVRQTHHAVVTLHSMDCLCPSRHLHLGPSDYDDSLRGTH